MKKYLTHLRQWLSSDPGKPLDVLDYKVKKAFNLKFASFMDKTLVVRRDKNDRDGTEDYVVSGQEDDNEDDEY
jgi:hypothetical protein